MTSPVKPPSRRYQSVVRAEQAGQTRRRVLDAAQRLFLEHGYVGTTIAAVAAEAGVTPETIYVSFRSKRGLLEGVIEATILGPEGPLPHAEQSSMKAIEQLGTARERLGAFVDFCCDVIARTSPLHVVIRGAADGEAFAVDLRQRLLDERLALQKKALRKFLAGALRAGLTMDHAAQRFCALTSPELYHLLTVELGCTPEEHRKWLHGLLETDLLGSE